MGPKTGFILFLILIVASSVASITAAKLFLSPSTGDYTAQAQEVFNQAKQEFEQIRNATLPATTLHIITKAEAVAMWGSSSSSQDLTSIQRQENIYKGLFLIPQNESLYQENREWVADWGAATVGKDVYVIRENFNPFNMPDAEATFVHELTHVWQPDLPNPTTVDEEMAHTALVEGDASYMADIYMSLAKGQANVTQAGVNSVSVYLLESPLLADVHPMINTLWDLDYFPYDQGKAFVKTLYEQGGFAAVDQAYVPGYVPDTTQQILHPDKYFANETAQAVQAPTLAESKWTLVQTGYGQNQNTYGEYFVQVMLANWINQSEAQQAAAGWGGDNFTYYERGSDYLFTWNIKWDSSCDASEFYAAFNNMMNATGALKENLTDWYANGRYLSISWNQNSNTTLIAVSTDKAAVLSSYFS
jgi:hypothetical protein